MSAMSQTQLKNNLKVADELLGTGYDCEPLGKDDCLTCLLHLPGGGCLSALVAEAARRSKGEVAKA